MPTKKTTKKTTKKATSKATKKRTPKTNVRAPALARSQTPRIALIVKKTPRVEPEDIEEDEGQDLSDQEIDDKDCVVNLHRHAQLHRLQYLKTPIRLHNIHLRKIYSQ